MRPQLPLAAEVRPTPPLSSDEVARELVMGIRARQLKSLAQLNDLYAELFPDHGAEERERHLRHLAHRLTSSLTPAEKAEARRHVLLRRNGR